MNTYKVLSKQVFVSGNYSIVPIRFEDRYAIMKWRNEQIYHLRQNKPLFVQEQDKYFNTIVALLFDMEQPDQILFSYLEGDKCIGYGGLVHINWKDKNAEISFIMDTAVEKDFFETHWITFLGLIEEVAFNEMGFHKLYTYAFDLRPHLYSSLESANFIKEAVLKEHCLFEGVYFDVVIHSKISNVLYLIDAKIFDAELTFKWATDSIIRRYSFNKDRIDWKTHLKWYSKKLSDKNCEYYLMHDRGYIIGSIRFDIEECGSVLISYLIDPAFHGKGYGKIILDDGVKKLKDKRKDVSSVYGIVQLENKASVNIFEKLGYIIKSIDATTYKFEKAL